MNRKAVISNSCSDPSLKAKDEMTEAESREPTPSVAAFGDA